MDNLSVVGVDLAKSIFHFCGVTKRGRILFRKREYRSDVLSFVAKLPKCIIAMESCGGSSYWAREFEALGHKVKLIAPQFVKPFVKSNKNDHADAEAICEAALRPTMRFVSPKTVEKQDIQSMHRVRERLVRNRTALSNEIRGLLLEYGVTIPQGISQIRKNLTEILEKNQNKLTERTLRLMRLLKEEFDECDNRITTLMQELKAYHKDSALCQRITEVGGVGVLGASAVVSYVGSINNFKNGRSFSAYFGLVPRQHSTGGKANLLGISKRGDKYIRKLLIHGARTVITHLKDKKDPRSCWIRSLVERRGYNIACVALANKNARIIWAIMAHDQEYDLNYKKAA